MCARSFVLPSVITFSTNGRSALAFGKVVMTRSWKMSDTVKFLRSAARCAVFRCSDLPATLCIMAVGLRRSLVLAHAEAQVEAERGELVLDLLERGLAEVAHLEQLRLGHLHQ